MATKKNKEGLTWEEWVQAAGFSVGEFIPQYSLQRLEAGWENGEDPSEYLAARASLRDERKGACEGEHIGKIMCPKCKNDDSTKFRYVEQIEAHRQVTGISGGVVLVESRYATGEGYDDGIPGTEYFECHNLDDRGHECLHRIPVPEFVKAKIDWV